MKELVTFLVAIAAVLVPFMTFASEQRRRHRNAIDENLGLAEAFASRDPAIAARFHAYANELASDYLDEVENGPVVYPKAINVTAFVLAVAATAAIGGGATGGDFDDPTVNIAGGILAGLLVVGFRPMVNDAWSWLKAHTVSLRTHLGLP